MKKTVSRSPLPKKVKKPKENTMDFYEALKAVVSGQRIQRLEWEDKKYYGIMDKNELCLHKPGDKKKPDGKNHPWIISDGDLGGDDWIVI